jgi:structural maintenance of chromosome 1
LEISRTSLWRRCVVAPFPEILSFLTACWQNLREEVAMDVDEGEEGDTIQHLKKVPDYGIEVDFDILSSDEREVSASSSDSIVYL